MSLRSILGGSSRIRKASKASSTGSANRASPSKSKASQASPQSRRKASSGASSSNRRGARPPADEEDDDDLFQDKLDDVGLVRTLATDPNLRDTAQAIHHIHAHMFSPMPQEAAGMGSARVAEVLNYRRRLPPLVSVSHIQTLLASPSAVEREVAEGKLMVDAAKAAGAKLLVWSGLEDYTKGTQGAKTHVVHFDGKAAVTEYAF